MLAAGSLFYANPALETIALTDGRKGDPQLDAEGKKPPPPGSFLYLYISLHLFLMFFICFLYFCMVVVCISDVK